MDDLMDMLKMLLKFSWEDEAVKIDKNVLVDHVLQHIIDQCSGDSRGSYTAYVVEEKGLEFY